MTRCAFGPGTGGLHKLYVGSFPHEGFQGGREASLNAHIAGAMYKCAYASLDIARKGTHRPSLRECPHAKNFRRRG